MDLDEEINEQEINEIMQGNQNLILDMGDRDNMPEADSKDRLKNMKSKQMDKRKLRKLEEKQQKEEEEQFNKDYYKLGGIQHIICSATMTIDNAGRVTPRMQQIMKKKGLQQS